MTDQEKATMLRALVLVELGVASDYGILRHRYTKELSPDDIVHFVRGLADGLSDRLDLEYEFDVDAVPAFVALEETPAPDDDPPSIIGGMAGIFGGGGSDPS